MCGHGTCFVYAITVWLSVSHVCRGFSYLLIHPNCHIDQNRYFPPNYTPAGYFLLPRFTNIYVWSTCTSHTISILGQSVHNGYTRNLLVGHFAPPPLSLPLHAATWGCLGGRPSSCLWIDICSVKWGMLKITWNIVTELASKSSNCVAVPYWQAIVCQWNN